MPPITPPPPEPDLVAARGTDQWRDAVHAKKQWVAFNALRGVPLDELMDKYGEGGSSREGRLSHDYEYWSKALKGETLGDEGLPGELGDQQWDIGNFQRQTKQGDFTEWPPGSGRFFNDPGNDQEKRQWFDEYGQRIGPPADGGPEIDYAKAGGDVKGYLARKAVDDAKEAEYRKAEAKAKPIGYDEKPTSAGSVPVAAPATMPTPDMLLSRSAMTGQPQVIPQQGMTAQRQAMTGNMGSAFGKTPASGTSPFGQSLTPTNGGPQQMARPRSNQQPSWYSSWKY